MDKEQIASEMSLSNYGLPLVITYSGGKDSDVVLELAKRSGIPYEVHNSHTTVDAPETVRYIRSKFRALELEEVKCTIQMPTYKGQRVSMWSLIPIKRMPPTRIVRYCCPIIKESQCNGRMIATGVRWVESTARSNRGIYEVLHRKTDKRIMLNSDNDDRRKLIEQCIPQRKTVCNPIIDWSDSDIWGFIRGGSLNYNILYDCGFLRVGCIGCPMASKSRYMEFARYPKYKAAYISAFDRMLASREGVTTWESGQAVFDWWMEKDPDQLRLEDYFGEWESYD